MSDQKEVVEVTTPIKCVNCESPIETGEKATKLEDVAKGVPGGILCSKCSPLPTPTPPPAPEKPAK